MSKKYKKKIAKGEIEEINEEENTLTKKEQYDLNKKKKIEEKQKIQKKNAKKNKSKPQHKNLGAKIFAIIMIILMLGSVVATIGSYIQR